MIRAWCSVCSRDYAVRLDGRIRHHREHNQQCLGAGRPPAPAEAICQMHQRPLRVCAYIGRPCRSREGAR